MICNTRLQLCHCVRVIRVIDEIDEIDGIDEVSSNTE